MSVKSVTPTDAASNPSHPDHARWVKERTLAMEVKHAEAMGASLRDAEDTNRRLLERLDQRRSAKPRTAKPQRKPNLGDVTKRELADANVTRRPVKARAPLTPPCKFCGVCRDCKLVRRTQAIMAKARVGDPSLLPLVLEMVGLELAQQQRTNYRDALGREYPFARLNKRDANRAKLAGFESVCDRSVSLMGAWR